MYGLNVYPREETDTSYRSGRCNGRSKNYETELFITRPISEISNEEEEEDEEECLSSSSSSMSRPDDVDNAGVEGLVSEMLEWNSRQQASMMDCTSTLDDDTRPRPKTRQDNIRR